MAAAEVEEAVPAGGADEIKPYRIHVSSKYLELTKQKLEVTRLPHEFPEPKSKDWWEPKSQIEPLIDFWLEQYSWRVQEDLLNTELPQFRTEFSIPSSEAIVRINFIHARSSHSNAIPLLLIPPFPFSNLSFGHLVKLFTEPEDVANNQPFHLVIPALPGLGFSDALPNNTPMISSTGEILNSLMSRLSYPHYLITNASSGINSPAEIDFKIANYLVTHHSDSCLGAHLISPPLARPKLREAPVEWAKWSVASLFRAPILGYRKEDFSALKRNSLSRSSKKTPTPARFGLNQLGLREPNTLAYALCDSPTGLLVFVLKSLRLLDPKKEFAPTEVINFTQLSWLPGPESAMRFWAHCARYPEVDKKVRSRPKIGITVFLGDEPSTNEDTEAEAIELIQDEAKDCYMCPSWAKTKYNVVHVNRAIGRSGLLAWDRPEIIATGVRGVAASILRSDSRLRPAASPTPAPAVADLERVVVHDDTTVEQPSSPPAQTTPTLLVPPRGEERNQPHREVSDETAVGSNEDIPGKTLSPAPKVPSPTHLAPPADEREHPRREASDDTAVEQSNN
ncbi:putative epoxide hydrolase [Daldinia childiae]|uniref:putative epoxide hydrolase n=1 Tax=Daldinia childiae TaxID=326645 RepID=UPI0014468DD6|nr:putative epoxide hydrolase [Daldinia childiae]KAF3064151.1 putative epoxide hydrolase [Daldinia childiae]